MSEPKTTESSQSSWTQNPRLLKFISALSAWFVVSEFGLLFWIVPHLEQYQKVGHIPWIVLFWVIQIPFTLFGALWLYIRNLRSLRSWWRSLSQRNPAAAEILVVVGWSSPLLGLLVGVVLIAMSK